MSLQLAQIKRGGLACGPCMDAFAIFSPICFEELLWSFFRTTGKLEGLFKAGFADWQCRPRTVVLLFQRLKSPSAISLVSLLPPSNLNNPSNLDRLPTSRKSRSGLLLTLCQRQRATRWPHPAEFSILLGRLNDPLIIYWPLFQVPVPSKNPVHRNKYHPSPCRLR
jgi:hypothetical protein